MYLLRNVIILSFLGVLLFGCSRVKDEELYIDIDVKKLSSRTFDDYIDHVELLQLEMHQEALIRSVSKVVDYNGFLFIQNSTRGLYVFDSQGKYVRSIGAIGVGPGEFLYIADFQINRFTGNIEILEPLGKVKIFSIEGEYLGYYGTRFQEVSYFKLLDEDRVLFSHNSMVPTLNIYSRFKDSIVKSFFDFSEDFSIFRPLRTDSHYYLFDKEVMVHHGYTNTIYRLDGDTLIPVRNFDFGIETFNIETYDWSNAESGDEELVKFISKKYVYGFFDDYEIIGKISSMKITDLRLTEITFKQ